MKTNKLVSLVATIAILVFALSTPTLAGGGPVTLTIGSGGESGTYYPVISEIGEFCSSQTLAIEHYTEGGKSVGGSINNMRNLLNNKIMAGIIQNDVAHLEAMNNPAMKRIQALLPLHQEQVHVIVPLMTNVMIQESTKGVMGFGAKEAVYERHDNPLENIAQLAGYKVAAWGGSVKTAEIIKLMGDIAYEIVPAKDQQEAMDKLDGGEVGAVLAVVGFPAKWVESLAKGKYKFLSVTKPTQDKLNNIYSMTKISYDNMDKTGQAVEALAVDSILFTRVYRTPKMISALSELKQCVETKVFEIQDTPGTHPVWQGIDPKREMKWENVFKGNMK